MAEVKDILKQRGAIYGDYKGNVMLRHDIMALIDSAHREENGGLPMNPISYGYIWDIVNKLIRLSTTPTHIDSWQDISGYATLVAKQLIKESPNAS